MKEEERVKAKGRKETANQDIDTQGINWENEIHSGRENQERERETRVRKYHPDEKKEETWGKKMKRGGRQEEDEDEREKTTTTTWHLRVKKKKRGGEEEDNEETQDAFPFIPLFVALSVALFFLPSMIIIRKHHARHTKDLADRDQVCEESEGRKQTRKRKFTRYIFNQVPSNPFHSFLSKSSIWVIEQFKRNPFLRLSLSGCSTSFSLSLSVSLDCKWLSQVLIRSKEKAFLILLSTHLFCLYPRVLDRDDDASQCLLYKRYYRRGVFFSSCIIIIILNGSITQNSIDFTTKN